MKTVFSLVSNPGTNDARVMKQARALVNEGYRVRIYGRLAEGFSEHEVVDESIEVYRFPCFMQVDMSFGEMQKILSAAGQGIVDLFSEYLEASLDSSRLLGEYLPERNSLVDKVRLAGDHVSDMKVCRKAALKKINKLSSRVEKTVSLKYFLMYFFPKEIKRRSIIKKSVRKYEELCSLIESGKKSREIFKNELKCFDEISSRETLVENVKKNAFFCRYAFYAAQFLSLDHDVKPDVIHSHDLHPLLGAVLLGKKMDAKVIYDAHEIEVERVPPLPPEKKSFIDSLERLLFKNVDQIVTVCKFAVDFYDNRFGYRRPELVMNSPEINKEKHEKHMVDIRALAGVSPEDKVVVYIGGVGREARGMDKFICSLVELKDYHLVILGPRQIGNDRWLVEVAESCGVNDRVHMIPSVSSDIVVPVIRSADLGVCLIQDVSLSYRYSMPNKLFEMAFAGLPIVVSDLPEMAEFVRRFNLGVVVDQTDPRDIADGVNEVYFNRDKFHPTPEKKAEMNCCYSWDAQAKSLLKAYEIVLGGNVVCEKI